ncbi:hypothetical protein BDV26DRAFT_300285 [Aspergillus bertholletiae]|uniref:Protein kinase domain-containing protein n=1 Tax=Aspergillus bertholletiae TaxID=1226010 RepID=A0A5N7AX96_9EURO|nr:hypothetical protein BDV26DRAFT_300285 [Aspergillus bertholletiae]
MASSTPQRKALTGSEKIFQLGTWRFEKLLSVKERDQSELDGGDTSERHEVYEAMRIDQPSKTPDIIKVKRQTGFWSNRNYRAPSDEIHREIDNLRQLHNCMSTPELIYSCVDTQGSDDELPGGYIAFIVMQKVPGRRLEIFERLTPHEQNRVRIAFVDALWEFCSNYFIHSDSRRENLIWNSEANRCFIIDLEDAEQCRGLTKNDVCLDPDEELGNWGLSDGESRGLLFDQKYMLMEYVKAKYLAID